MSGWDIASSLGDVRWERAIALLVAVAFDASFGEVPSAIHPVVGIGRLTRRLLGDVPDAFHAHPVTRGEQAAAGAAAVHLNPGGRRAMLHRTPLRQFVFGAAVSLAVIGVCGALAWATSWGLSQARGYWGSGSPMGVATSIVEGALLSTLFAARGLIAAGRRMRDALARSVQEGRDALAHLCSRDPSLLDEEQLCGATVESLAENASDSFVAPLFWYGLVAALGGSGLVAAACYRAVNTLDAMIGYRGKYEYVGKFAARLDDVLNWIPARLTALFLLMAGGCAGGDFVRGWQVARAEHSATESPNAGWPMAMAAGLLGVELSKPEAYVLGRGLAAPTPRTIARSERLVTWTFVSFTFAATLVAAGVLT